MSYNLFSDLKKPRDLSGYTLFRGTTDWTQLQQFDLYESGFPYLVLVSVPEFLEKMADNDEDVRTLLDSYKHIIEYEFKGLGSGIDNLGTDNASISNGIQEMNIITKTNGINATNISMNYTEKSGAPLTKLHELYLRSVRDPASGFKHYGGLIGTNESTSVYLPEDAGFHKETFSFLYMHTDNTGLRIERAIYYVGCMPTSAQLDIYNGQRGDVQFQEVSCEFTAFPIMGAAVNKRAREILDWMNSESNANMVQRNSWNYNYNGIGDSIRGLGQSKLAASNAVVTP